MYIQVVMVTIALSLFFMSFLMLGAWTYKQGIEAGLSITKKDVIPALLKTPNKTASVKKNEEVDKIQEGINNIFTYDGEVKPNVN